MTPGIVRTEEVEAEDRLAVDRSTAYAAAHFGGKIVGHACMLNVGDKPAHVAYPVATAPRGGG